MTESQDHRPPWRVSDLELTALAGVIEKFAGPAKEYSSQVAYLQSMSVLDLRDARARIEELEEQLALGARMEAHLAEKLDHADTALLKAMDRIKELEAALDASIALRKEAEEQFAVAAEANVRTEARIKELEATVLRMKGMVALAEGAEQMSTERIVELEAALLPFAEMEDDDLPVGEQYRAKFIRARRVMSEGE